MVRPVLSPMPAGTTLRVELLAERRGSELRADVTAEAETVHVRVWQDGVEALDRALPRGAPDRRRPAGRGDRGRRARPGRRRRAAIGGGARRIRPMARDADDRTRRCIVVADGDAVAAAAADRIADGAAEPRSTRAAAPTGRRPAARRRRHLPRPRRAARCATPSRGTRSTSGGATTATCRATTRCPTSSRSTTSCSTIAGREEGTPLGESASRPGAAADREPPPVPDRRGDRRRPGRGLVRRQRSPRSSRAAGLPEQRRLAGLRPGAARRRRRRARAVGLSRVGGVRRRRSWRWPSRRRPTSSRTSSA